MTLTNEAKQATYSPKRSGNNKKANVGYQSYRETTARQTGEMDSSILGVVKPRNLIISLANGGNSSLDGIRGLNEEKLNGSFSLYGQNNNQKLYRSNQVSKLFEMKQQNKQS